MARVKLKTSKNSKNASSFTVKMFKRFFLELYLHRKNLSYWVVDDSNDLLVGWENRRSSGVGFFFLKNSRRSLPRTLFSKIQEESTSQITPRHEYKIFQGCIVISEMSSIFPMEWK